MKKVLLSLSICFLVSASYAGISILPMRFEYLSLPGVVLDGSYQISNPTQNKVRVTVSPKDYYILEENKGIKQQDWFEMSEKAYDLNPGETKNVDFKIKVPRQAKGFLMMLNSFLSQEYDDKGVIVDGMLKTQYSIPVYVKIKDTEKYSLEIEKIQFAKMGSEFNALVSISNTGNIYLRPYGSVVIFRKTLFSKKLLGSMETKQGWPVFPKQPEAYKASTDKLDIKPGSYTAVVKAWCDEPAVLKTEKTYDFSVTKTGEVIVKESSKK
jgi:hypothetical protein